MKHLHPRAVFLFWNYWFWVYIFWLLVINVFALSFWLAKSSQFGVKIEGTGVPLQFIGLLVIAYLWARLSYNNYKYELAEDALKVEKGVIWKRYIAIPYDRIQNVDIYRGILARLLGLSDLHVQTAGQVQGRGYNIFSEGRLLGLEKKAAEKLRDELISKVKRSRQGLQKL